MLFFLKNNIIILKTHSMKKNKPKSDIFLDIIYWIAGAVIFAGLMAIVWMIASTSLSASSSDMLVETRSCCCCCRCPQANLDDEVIYTMEQKAEKLLPVGEPPPRPVILSR